MTEVINEPVEVIVAYKQDGHKAVPTIMTWQSRTYKFSDFGFYHPVRQGTRLFHIFTMADNAMTYRLAFDTEALSWELQEVTDGLGS